MCNGPYKEELENNWVWPKEYTDPKFTEGIVEAMKKYITNELNLKEYLENPKTMKLI